MGDILESILWLEQQARTGRKGFIERTGDIFEVPGSLERRGFLWWFAVEKRKEKLKRRKEKKLRSELEGKREESREVRKKC